jgi:hypothetical protein
MLLTIIDTAELWKIVVAILIVGVGVTAVFGEGAFALERYVAARREHRGGAVLANGAELALVALVCIACLVAGVVAMTHK